MSKSFPILLGWWASMNATSCDGIRRKWLRAMRQWCGPLFNPSSQFSPDFSYFGAESVICRANEANEVLARGPFTYMGRLLCVHRVVCFQIHFPKENLQNYFFSSHKAWICPSWATMCLNAFNDSLIPWTVSTYYECHVACMSQAKNLLWAQGVYICTE